MNDSQIIDKAYGMLKVFMDGMPKTHNEIILATQNLLNILKCETSNNNDVLLRIVDMYEENIGTKSYEPDVLTDINNNTSWMYDKKEKIEHRYFGRYKDYLRNEDFSEDSIVKMEKSTEKILSYCANPENDFAIKGRKKKGLIIGDVQSGKTANYLALINMAADYGYKLIVLLAGLTDSLRIQTQKRVDSGFVGANSSTISGNIDFIGVGEVEQKYYAIPMTDQDQDFGKFVKTSVHSTIGDYNKPIIMVVKKNKSILSQMKDWVKPDLNGIKCHNILIIDDEADNASVNTKKPEEDPSIINKLIRDLFNNFPIATYIGYTATPFANIFIDPCDDESNKDLFPSDFIIQLKEPDNYFGSKKSLLGLNRNRHIRILDEDEPNFLLVNHKKDADVYPEMPDSLMKAINDFLITNVIRTLEGQKKKHRTMMINVSRFNSIQDTIHYKVSCYIERLKNSVEQSFKLGLSDFIKDKRLKDLYNQYINDKFYEMYQNKYSWEQIQNNLYDEIKMFDITIINNKNSKKNRYNYDDYKDIGARVIVIGGFVLSRGLTLEGLTTSYFSRNASAYDTMLQMCRWFGYRRGYESLCRIYISEINLDNFGAIIDAVDDLKEQFSVMAACGKTPQEFGLMVKESPDTLETSMLITSHNKSRNSKELYRSLNYSGVAVDTPKLYKDPDKNNKNLETLDEFVNELKKEGKILETFNNRNMFINVDKNIIAKFLDKLLIPLENKKFDKDSISEYIKKTDKFIKWDIAIATGSSSNNNWYFCHRNLPVALRSFNVREEENYIRISGNNNRLAEPGIYNAGLTDKEIKNAKELAKKRKTGKGEAIAKDYLSVSNRKPLLIIYPIQLNNFENDELKQKIVNNYINENVLLGFAIGFPGIESKVIVKYRANEIKIKELSKSIEVEEVEEVYDED